MTILEIFDSSAKLNTELQNFLIRSSVIIYLEDRSVSEITRSQCRTLDDFYELIEDVFLDRKLESTNEDLYKNIILNTIYTMNLELSNNHMSEDIISWDDKDIVYNESSFMLDNRQINFRIAVSLCLENNYQR